MKRSRKYASPNLYQLRSEKSQASPSNPQNKPTTTISTDDRNNQLEQTQFGRDYASVTTNVERRTTNSARDSQKTRKMSI